MPERSPESGGFDRAKALRAIVEDFGFNYLLADSILGSDPSDHMRRYRAFRDIAESVDTAASDAFEAVWNAIVMPSLAEAGYDLETSRHRAVFKNVQTGETVDPATACTRAKTVLERWQEPDGPEVVSIWFQGFAGARTR